MYQEEDLKRLHEGAIKDDPFISAALGPKAKVERMRAAALRLGSQGLSTSYDDHLLIIGDAAGHIDPLTGEGIHTAMMVRPFSLVSLRSRAGESLWAARCGTISMLSLCSVERCEPCSSSPGVIHHLNDLRL